MVRGQGSDQGFFISWNQTEKDEHSCTNDGGPVKGLFRSLTLSKG